jgi:type IV pilus assembly protein PilC
MVRVGEETGKLNQTFLHLADYLDRQYALTSKTKNALIYPAFVVMTFFVVMTLMFTIVIPKLASIITDSGQPAPFFTQIVIGVSNLFVHYGIFVLILLVLGGLWIWRASTTPKGKEYLDTLKLSMPVIGNLYRKLFLSRITDNLNTMLSSGVPIVRAIDITSQVVGSLVYKNILDEVADGVKSGLSLSAAFEKHKDYIPPIMIQMVLVGEETGSLGSILKTLTDFYAREVDGAVDTLVGLIEPIMIVVLGVGVGILLVSVLMPIYNMSSSIS